MWAYCGRGHHSTVSALSSVSNTCRLRVREEPISPFSAYSSTTRARRTAPHCTTHAQKPEAVWEGGKDFCCLAMDQVVSQFNSVLCTLRDKKDQSKYVCFTQKKPSGIIFGLSNGEAVWKADLSEETLLQLKKKLSLKSTEDYALKVKSACRSGSAYVSLQKDNAVLHLGSEGAEFCVSFSKLTDHEGRTELKDLLFKMADSLMQQDSLGDMSSSSPVTTAQKRNSEFEPRRQPTGPTIAVKKRLPGDSLINPGTKRKRSATGVAFDDGDDS